MRHLTRRAIAGLVAATLLMTGACSSGEGDKPACEDMGLVGLSNVDYDKLFKDHRDLSDELRSALKDLEAQPAAADRATKVVALCAKQGVNVKS